jgi:UDP-GlcNAc3NAcA epimerase
MIRILTIIGARPQIIKAAALSRAIRTVYNDQIQEIIVHTGQHYDENMSAVFMNELEIPKENYNLQSGSGTHGKQTAVMMEGIEKILQIEKPDAVVVYGDTNSTIAGGIAASKLHVPVFHIEAGLRSFNKSMPEEINRICCDHVSTLLFSPTKTAVDNLKREGFDISFKGPFDIDHPGIFLCGDIMYDNSLHFAKVAGERSAILKDLAVKENEFILATIHRESNTDNPQHLTTILNTIIEIAEDHQIPVILPLHPRTKKMIEQLPGNDYFKNRFLRIIPPASFLDMTLLEAKCKLVMTDSGGVQKEAYFFNKPCIILREETEWVELVQQGCAILAGTSNEKIKNAYKYFNDKRDLKFPALFGDGKAAEHICSEIVNIFSQSKATLKQ